MTAAVSIKFHPIGRGTPILCSGRSMPCSGALHSLFRLAGELVTFSHNHIESFYKLTFAIARTARNFRKFPVIFPVSWEFRRQRRGAPAADRFQRYAIAAGRPMRRRSRAALR
jgi:hypothetical protein